MVFSNSFINFIIVGFVVSYFIYFTYKEDREKHKKRIHLFLNKLNSLEVTFIDLEINYVRYLHLEDKLLYVCKVSKNIPIGSYLVYKTIEYDSTCLILTVQTDLGLHLLYLINNGDGHSLHSFDSSEDNLGYTTEELCDFIK